MTMEPVQEDPRWSADELIPFGKYLLLERISSGATASVYRAKIHGAAGFERTASIKRILPHMAGDPEFVDTFVREAKTAARLSHTNICPIYELGRVGESLYMAMECVDGKDLGRIMRNLARMQIPIPPIAAAWITARLCDALDYAHGLTDAHGKRVGIVHRDLSPANVLVSYDGHVKLIDFGLAKAVGRAQQTNVDALKRKLGYMSPEMVKGRPPDARSDVFGVGVLLHEMLTERRLFAGKDDIATLTMVSKASVPPPSALMEDAPEALELVVMRALEREPEDRWQTAGEMAQALTEYIVAEHPLYGPRQLCSFVQGLFAESMKAETERTRTLLEASNDPKVLAERRAFFASAKGIAAAARAQFQPRSSERPPPGRTPAQSASTQPPPPDAGANDGDDKQEEEEELTTLMDSELEEEERTEFLDEHDLQVVAVAEGGFEEEATEIFFNKEEGLGLGEGMMDTTGTTAPGRRRGVHPGPEIQPPQAADSSARAAPSSLQSMVAPAGSTTGPVDSPGNAAPTAGSLHPAPTNHDQAPADSTKSASRRPRRARATTVLDQRASRMRSQERLSNWMLVAGVILLALAITGLLLRTPLGARLGIRSTNRGTIEVRTNPPVEASVKLDDVYRGRAPLRLGGVLRGSHKLEIEATGYLSVDKEIPLEGGETKILEFVLSPAASDGPAGAGQPGAPIAPPQTP